MIDTKDFISSIHCPSVNMPPWSPMSALCLTTTAIGSHVFNRFGVLKNSMSNHTYKPNRCEGGWLHYQGDMPLLSIESDDPYIAGKANGYLTAPQVLKLCRKASIGMGQPKPSEAKKKLEEIKKQIPKEYLEELRGIKDGINAWIDEQ